MFRTPNPLRVFHRLGLWSTALLFVWVVPSRPAAAERPSPDLQAGQAAYTQSCARCHGATGKGDGLDAARFYPRPRDLELGVYKFRTTISGTPPTDEDLFHTVTNGLPGSNMPDWRHLDEETRWQLVYYLKSLSSIFEEVEPEPVDLGDDPGPTRADLEQGTAVYKTLGCAACHGAAGRANGPSAAGLVDDWEMPIRSANLTQGWSYRGGREPRDIMTRLIAGIDGAGMPSYAEAVSPEEAWHLAYYVASLQEPANWNMIAHPLHLAGALPERPDDPRWEQAAQSDVRVRNVVTAAGEWKHPPTVTAVAFRAVYNDEAVAFRVSWDDPTQETDTAPDGRALMLKPSEAVGDTVTLQAWPYSGAPSLDACYWSAGTGATTERLVNHFDRAAWGGGSGTLRGRARYDDGRWTLVLQRPLHPATPKGAAVVTTDGLTSIAFAVWDGGNPEARAVSPWVDLSIRRTE